MQSDEGTGFIWVSRKRRCDKRSHLFNAMRARLGPPTPGVEGQSRMLETLRAYLGSLTATAKAAN